MKHIIITLLTFFTLHGAASAATDVNCIWIKHSNNSTSCIMLDSKPQITFEGNSVIIDSKSYHIDDIVSYRFGKTDESSVDNITADGRYFVFHDDVIEIKGFDSNGSDVTVQLFDSKGVMIQSTTHTVKSRQLRLDVKDLGAGVYLLTVDGSTFKFAKR